MKSQLSIAQPEPSSEVSSRMRRRLTQVIHKSLLGPENFCDFFFVSKLNMLNKCYISHLMTVKKL